MNNKGQFSIIAALLVAVVLIGSVVGTYSAIRYSPIKAQSQILSSVDETDQALKQLLGFTVGYYGSVLKVTGNASYAKQLAQNYLNSGISNLGSIKPERALSLNNTQVDLAANWFTNDSYSRGSMNVTYNLNGLGIAGVSYSDNCILRVQVDAINSTTQAQFKITTDNGEPLINLGADNIKFFRYVFGNLTWEFSVPTNVVSHADGTYIVDLPNGVASNAYVVQIEDTRGLSVLASSFSKFTSTLAWNSTGYQPSIDYVDNANALVGTDSSFAAQQSAPDGIFDTLTEALNGTFTTDNYPSDWTPAGTTSNVAGSLTDLQNDNSMYMQLRSYPTAYSSSYNTIGFDSQSSTVSITGNSMSWTHTTGMGNDRILLVSIDIFNSGGTTTVTSAAYDGLPLTQVETDFYNTNPRVRSYVYYLLNPSPGTKTIVVTFAGSTAAVGGSITYNNVNQTTPILASNTATGSGASQSVTVTASGSNSKVLFGHLGTYRTGGYTITDGQPPTRWSQTTQQYKGIGSDKTVTSGSVSTSWTTSNTASWVAICILLQPTQVGTAFGCGAEFTGSSNTSYPWNNFVWAIDGSATTPGVSVSYQLYNYRTGQYATVGNGYLTDVLGTSDSTKTQTIAASMTDFRDASGNWKIKVSTNQTNTVQFDLKLDIVRYSVNEDNYGVTLQESWLNVNATNVHQDLCVKTGAMGSESLVVQVLHGGVWQNLMALTPNYFNNASLVPYIDSANLAIRFVGNNALTDPAQDTWHIDSVYLQNEPDINFLVNQQQSTFTLEILQNGTMNWLGQNMQLTTQTLPIPPVPVKAIHVNQTVNGVNQEVPFQIEDWASSYQIPLGLTSNTTLFSNRQMIVFLLNSKVSDFTVWWNGSDIATQTPLASTNRYFTNDNPAANPPTLTNGDLTLSFGNFNVKATVAGSSNSSTATFMRINQQASTYGAGAAFVIHHGVVRDIVQQESEWNNGATGCPNLYANIVLTFPANATYYTYQLRIMYINSVQARSINDLCPIQLTTTLASMQMQTENGTIAGNPILQNGTGTFLNSAVGSWTAHHFSQFISNDGKGAGIIYSDVANQRLYAFDSFAASTSKGALKASSGLLELLPVSSSQVQFTYAYDVTWQGAVATFDGTTPVCNLYDGTTPMGLWILAEYPPTLTVTANS